VNDIFEDGDDAHRERMRRLTPEQRGQMIMDQIAPRRYSWLKNQDGMTYLHEHEIGEAPPGSFALAATDTMAARSTAYRTPLWYFEGVADDD
jgi:hypothetical protein